MGYCAVPLSIIYAQKCCTILLEIVPPLPLTFYQKNGDFVAKRDNRSTYSIKAEVKKPSRGYSKGSTDIKKDEMLARDKTKELLLCV